MLTALPRNSTARGNRRRNREATRGIPINRTVCKTSSPNGAVWLVNTRVIAGTRPRPSTYERQGDHGPPCVSFQNGRDGHDRDRRGDRRHEHPAVPDLGIRTQDGERED